MNTALVASLIALNDGVIVGKTRLQKTVYLLEKFGMKSGFQFEYHNFGPYSAELAEACEAAAAEGSVKTDTKPGFYQVPYTVYSTTIAPPERVGELDSNKIKAFLKVMNGFTAVDLELAATMVFVESEGIPPAKIDEHVKVLKPLKAKEKNLARAHSLLQQLQAA